MRNRLLAYFSAKCRRLFNSFTRSSYLIENAPTSSERNSLQSPFENPCSDVPTYIIRKLQLFDVSFVTIPSQLNTYSIILVVHPCSKLTPPVNKSYL